MALCPNCGEENPDGFKFCGFCTAPLDAVPEATAEERKVVSVLFVDLVGFTARSHDSDPEDIHSVLVPYHRLLKSVIERFGGTVEKFIGDAVMAVFGAPVAHEDDAERAVRAALRITEAIEELNEATPNLDLSIRAAVNTGEGLVTLGARPQAGEGIVTGDVVNTASRLQNVAPVNGVVVGEITYRSTKNLIVYEDMEPVAVKGKPEPVAVWQAASARSRFGVDVETRYKTPFIGRDLDLATLRTAYQRTLRESSLQLVTVVGEPGVGKSRLLAEFASYVDEQDEIVSWRQGRSLPYGEGITFWALGEIVKAQAGILESDSPETALDKLRVAVETVVEETDERVWFVSRLGPLVGAKAAQSGSAERKESFTAWRRFLEANASRSPLVLLFEDLHWADSAMLEFIDHLVEWSTGVPLLVVCSARPELYEINQGWSDGKRNSNTISLSPLSDSETAQLISGLLSQAVLPAEVHAALLERAGGNPLYSEEFIRMLSDRGILQRKGRVLTIDPDADIPIPDNVQALIAARLDTLTPERKALLHDASVTGKVFWSGAVATLGSRDDGEVREGLHELARKELVRLARNSSIEGQQEYAFSHALIRDVAYGQIPRRLRASRHRDTARWLEAATGDRVADQAEVLAHHYGEALKLVKAVGAWAEVSNLEEPARRSLIAAGDRARELDVAKARDYYLRALEVIPPDHAERARVLVLAGWTTRHAGQMGEAKRLYEEAIVEASAKNDRVTEGKAMAALAGALWYMGQTARSRDLGTKAVELLEQQSPGPELAAARLGLSDDALFAGDSITALRQAEAALALARTLGAQAHAVDARAQRGWARCELGDMDGLQDLGEALEEGLSLGFGSAVISTYEALATWTWWDKGPLSARGLWEEMIGFAEARGMAVWALTAKANSLGVLFDFGEWDGLLSLADELLQGDEATSSLQLQASVLVDKAHVLAWRGQEEQAASLKEQFLPLARDIGDLQALVPALVIASMIEHRIGNRATSVALAAEVEMLTSNSRWRVHSLPTILRVLAAGGEIDLGQVFLTDINVSAARDRHSVLTGQAILAEAKGKVKDARDVYITAAQRWADYGFVLEEGQAHLGLARCLIALGDQEAAIEALNKAHVIFSRLGAVPLVNETDTYLDQAEAAS